METLMAARGGAAQGSRAAGVSTGAWNFQDTFTRAAAAARTPPPREGPFGCETWKRKFVTGNPSYVREPEAQMWFGRSRSLGASPLVPPPEVKTRNQVSGFVGHIPGRRDVVGRQDLSRAYSSPRAAHDWGKKLPPLKENVRLAGFAGHVPSLRSRVGFRGCDVPDMGAATRRGGPEAAALGYPTEMGMKLHNEREEAIHGPSVSDAAVPVEAGGVRAPVPSAARGGDAPNYNLRTVAALAALKNGKHLAPIHRVMGAPETWECMARAPKAQDAPKVENLFDPVTFSAQLRANRRKGFEVTEAHRRFAMGSEPGVRDEVSMTQMSNFFGKERRDLRTLMERQLRSERRDMTKMTPAGGKAQTTVLDINYFVRGKNLEDMAGIFQPKSSGLWL